MKQTPLFDLHEKLGAKMGAFAGYSMPLFYPLGVMKEHLHTRAAAGLFDISHMVHIEIEGNQASAAISKSCPYDASSQNIGEAKYTFFLNEDAGIIDDLIITRLGDTRFLIVANAGCAEKDIAHITNVAANFDASVKVIPRGFIALQGPKAEDVLERLGIRVKQLDFMSGYEPQADWFVSRTGYTGEDGFEVALPSELTAGFCEKLLNDAEVEAI
ncbi:MAG: glycine cleavage system aminomethyltransferase T, partial [Nitratireductor sp.]